MAVKTKPARPRRITSVLALATLLSAAPFGVSGFFTSNAQAAIVPAKSAALQGEVALYRQLMELNGTSRNARTVLTNTRKLVLEAIEEERDSPLSTTDRSRFDALADAAFATLTEQILNLIATDQAPGLTEVEIRTLIAANTGLAAATYNAAKFQSEADSATDTQAHMVESVVEIIKAFRDSVPITDPGAITDEPSRVVQAATLLATDGTEQIVNHYVGTVYRGMILQTVTEYIDLETLSEADRTRLEGIINASINKLSNRILLRSARLYGQALTAEQLATLITANDNTAQRKLTRMRIETGDAADARSAELMTATVSELGAAFGVEVR